jgi:hypothetical protein
MRINPEPLNFSGVARIKIGHTPLLGFIKNVVESEEKNIIFLFRVPVVCGRTVTGKGDLKHLYEQRKKKHEASAANIENYVKFYIFGSVKILSLMNEGYRVSVQRHSELVLKN